MVCCIDEAGRPETRLITRYADLSSITLDGSRTPDETALAEARRKLRRIVRDEFEPTRRIPDLIRENQRTGKAHEVLSLLAADGMFPGFNHTEGDNFWQAVRAMDEVLQRGNRLTVPKIPVIPLARIRDDLLFDIHVPKTGDTTSLTLPNVLAEAAVNKAYREADAFREKRSALTIARVKARLRKALQSCLEQLGR